MLLPFVKMQGAGNDFVMVDGVTRPFTLNREQIRFVCDRCFGVGCDQMLVVEKSEIEGVDFKYRIFNQNGGEVEMCGNGARCFAVFVRHIGLTDKKRIRCETMRGIIEPEVCDDGRVTVNMGEPHFEPESLPFVPGRMSKLSRFNDTIWQIKAGGQDNWMSVCSMGNPHAVKIVGDVQTAEVEKIGADFQKMEAFPNQVNVGFMQIIDRGNAKVRVFERGVGETLACGTGACAAVVSGIRRGALDDAVEVQMHGGRLRIEWRGQTENRPMPVYLTGPAEVVFTGEIEVRDDL